jgi:hypothetical protein
MSSASDAFVFDCASPRHPKGNPVCSTVQNKKGQAICKVQVSDSRGQKDSRVVSENHLVTVVLLSRSAIVAVAETAQARIRLSSNTNTVANLDASGGLGSNSDSGSNNFMSNNNGVSRCALLRSISLCASNSTGLLDLAMHIPNRILMCGCLNRKYRSASL